MDMCLVSCYMIWWVAPESGHEESDDKRKRTAVFRQVFHVHDVVPQGVSDADMRSQFFTNWYVNQKEKFDERSEEVLLFKQSLEQGLFEGVFATGMPMPLKPPLVPDIPRSIVAPGPRTESDHP